MKNNLDLSPLDNYSLKGVTASIILDTRMSEEVFNRKTEKGESPENFTFPVKYRIRYNKHQDYYPCKNLTKEQYSRLQKATRDRDLIKDKKLIVDRFKEITDLIESIEPFSLNELAKRIKGGTQESLLNTFNKKIDFLKSEGRIGSSVWYSCAKKSIEKYTKKDLMFSDITPEWLKGYHKHLLKPDKKGKIKQDTTISINMRAIKAIINEAMRKGVISQMQYPFGEDKYQIPTGEGRKIALTTSQLMDVFNSPLPAQDEKWRDIFVFSFYCNGANVGDILRFRFIDIKHTIKGNIIEWYRQKTIKKGKKQRRLQAIITEEMQMIIERNSNPLHKPEDYIFPHLSNGLTPTRQREIIQEVTHVVNHKLKKIGDALGIEKLTTYAARHSFASISRRSGVDLFDISKSLGHSDIKTTEIYLDSLNIDELQENAAKLPRWEKSQKKKIVNN
jgi:integrase/recombinase XerD